MLLYNSWDVDRLFKGFHPPRYDLSVLYIQHTYRKTIKLGLSMGRVKLRGSRPVRSGPVRSGPVRSVDGVRTGSLDNLRTSGPDLIRPDP